MAVGRNWSLRADVTGEVDTRKVESIELLELVTGELRSNPM
jgi:hypothetical protein